MTPITMAIKMRVNHSHLPVGRLAQPKEKFGEPRLSRVRDSYLNLPRQVGALPVPFSYLHAAT